MKVRYAIAELGHGVSVNAVPEGESAEPLTRLFHYHVSEGEGDCPLTVHDAFERLKRTYPGAELSEFSV